MITNAPPSPYGRGHRALEVVSISFVFAALAWLAVRVVGAVERPRDVLRIALSGVVGYLLSDFLSGFVHWAGDTIGDEQTPVFGPNFVRPFRHHHIDPKDITRHDFVETNGNNCIVIAPVLLVLLVIMPATTGALFYGCLVTACVSWFVFCTNQFHKWAHEDDPARWVRVLQRWHLILPPDHHAIHHAVPQVRSYCITVGWMNPLLDRIRFFRFCEALVARVRARALHLEGRTPPFPS
jgi:hypothetical protein